MIYLRYLWTLLKHKWFVFWAGLGTVPLRRLIFHDASKFTRHEFPAYARRFGNGRAGKMDHSGDPDEWHRAWVHHWHRNPHHWEHWLKLDGDRVVPLAMPRTYILEMVADWRGASRAYTGSWDISEWWERNKGRIILHPKTLIEVEIVMDVTADLFTEVI